MDQVRVTTTKLGANLRDVEVELQFHELLLVKREFDKVKDVKVEFKNVSERLQHVSKDLDALVLKGDCANSWAQTCGHQIQLMIKGAKVINNPLPIEQPTTLTPNTFGVFFVNPCPICGLYFACNNLVLTSCGCTYHPFCLIVHVETKQQSVSRPKV